MGTVTHVCPRFHRAVELIGRRWTGAIIRALMDGSVHFSDLLAAVSGLHEPLLSERLKELEREGIVRRRVFADTPVRVEYALTTKGRSLERVTAEIQHWAERWVHVPPRRRVPEARQPRPASREPRGPHHRGAETRRRRSRAGET